MRLVGYLLTAAGVRYRMHALFRCTLNIRELFGCMVIGIYDTVCSSAILAKRRRCASSLAARVIFLTNILVAAAMIQVVHRGIILADKIGDIIICVVCRILFIILRVTFFTYLRRYTCCLAARVRLGYCQATTGVADIMEQSIVFIRSYSRQLCVIFGIELTVWCFAMLTRCKFNTGCLTTRVRFAFDSSAADMCFQMIVCIFGV